MREDPEVVADLKLRAKTTYDKSRTGGADAYDWREPATVAAWCCRTKTCRAPVRVTQDAVDMLATMNRLAKARGFERIREDEVMFCTVCEVAMRKERERIASRLSEVLSKAIVEIKKGPGDERERELIKKLEALGHPDVPGLVQAIREKRDASKGKRFKGGL